MDKRNVVLIFKDTLGMGNEWFRELLGMKYRWTKCRLCKQTRVGKVNSMIQGTCRSPIRPPPDDILGIILLLTENSGIY